jgi:hypothetical protein
MQQVEMLPLAFTDELFLSLTTNGAKKRERVQYNGFKKLHA